MNAVFWAARGRGGPPPPGRVRREIRLSLRPAGPRAGSAADHSRGAVHQRRPLRLSRRRVGGPDRGRARDQSPGRSRSISATTAQPFDPLAQRSPEFGRPPSRAAGRRARAAYPALARRRGALSPRRRPQPSHLGPQARPLPIEADGSRRFSRAGGAGRTPPRDIPGRPGATCRAAPRNRGSRD